MFDEKPTRSKATRKAYLKAAKRLTAQAVCEGGQTVSGPGAGAVILVAWFIAANGRWVPSTIRSYHAAIMAFLEISLEKFPDDRQFQAALDQLKAAPAPAPRIGGPPRTSARKAKSASPSEFEAVLTELAGAPHACAAIAYGLLLYGAEFGLRPGEWPGASIGTGFLVVPNAKRSNDRANGETRSLDLARFPKEFVSGLEEFLSCLANALSNQSWAKTVYPAARGQLRAACKRAGKWVPSLRRKLISFYTTRHVAAGRAKSSMPHGTVAALMGHASDRTATIHYARARSVKGWGPLRTEPAAAQIATVRPSFRGRKDAAAPAKPRP